MKKILLTGFALVSMLSQAQSWVPQGTKFPANFGVDEIDIVDANTVWIFAYDGSGAGTYPKIVSRTTNGGTTWTANNITGPGSNTLVSDLSAIDGNTAWVVTAPASAGTNANRIWKTTNGGTSWTQQTVGYTSGSFANHIYFWDANNGWTSGDPLNGKFEMFKTSNGGTTWTAVPGAPVPENGDDFTYVGLKEVVGDNIWIGTSVGRILHSPDRGNTWTGNYSPVLDFGGVITSGSSGAFAFKDANNGLLLAVDGADSPTTLSAGLYSTNDGGVTWDPVTPNGTWFFGDIAYVPGTANTYVTTGINSAAAQGTGSAYSTDGGLNWTIIDNIPGIDGGQRGKVSFLNPTTGWTGYFSDGPSGTQGIFKFSGNLALGVSDNAVKSNLKVYPNPATDIVNISANRKIENVTVMDMTGKKVQSFKAGNQINVSSLAKGTYILQVYYGEGAVENTKLIKK
ncbi:T9SS type A sorting domain-containing protein [Kaistella sp. BT6-1-3]|uniref:T9SS type A sorting domain-containing protein n=1 Tax=Kaistella yananensis TaxID=2989820 RepID=A0ABT3JLS7_9FLAO|nr:T9SS type A sorting domain-containing protein [Kaistella yananensis]MCW4451735.1 T9SS type A sorting domain-containing protein [Kaistella yananensis]